MPKLAFSCTCSAVVVDPNKLLLQKSVLGSATHSAAVSKGSFQASSGMRGGPGSNDAPSVGFGLGVPQYVPLSVPGGLGGRSMNGIALPPTPVTYWLLAG